MADLDTTLATLQDELGRLRRKFMVQRIMMGVLAVLVVAGGLLIVSNRNLTNNVSANTKGDVVRACQTVNRANQITREAFDAQADIFAKIIPPTPAGLDALAQLREAVPEDKDHDCNADGTVDTADYPS